MGDVSQLTAAGQIVGSPAYMAPEQARGEEVDGRGDQYALGVVLYEMAAGRPPFQADSPTAMLMQHVSSPPPLPRSLNPLLPEAVQAVLLKALAKQPGQRFPSVSDLAAAFRRALAGEAPAADDALPPDAATLVEAAAVGEAPATAMQATGKLVRPSRQNCPAPAGRAPQADRGDPLVDRPAEGGQRLRAPGGPAGRGHGRNAPGAARPVGRGHGCDRHLAGQPAAPDRRLQSDLPARGCTWAALPYLIAVLLAGGALLSARVALRTASGRGAARPACSWCSFCW